MNDYYGVTTPTDDFLAHYGIKGMKWGVRKFTSDISGKSNKKFDALYGPKATKKVSAHKMQKHYNALDQSRANINQRMRGDLESFMAEAVYGDAMRKSNSPHWDEKENQKHLQRQAKYIETFSQRKKQLDNLQKMQNDIMKAAKRRGYSASYTPIERSGIVGIPTKMQGTKAEIKNRKKRKSK